MQIRIKKKSSILSVLIILFLVTTSLSVYFLFFNKEKEEDDYDKLFKHCIEEENNRKECKVFLKELRKEKNKVCMDIMLPEIEVEERYITVCFNSNIEWEDPYEEYPYEQYFMTTPIVLTLEYSGKVRKSSPSDLEIRIMEDDEANSVLEIKGLNRPDVSGMAFVSKENYEFVSKGYLYTLSFLDEQRDYYQHLNLIGAELQSIEKKDEKIEMIISLRMDDSNFTYEFDTQQFRFYDSDELWRYDLDAQTDLSDYLNLNEYYLVTFSLYDLEQNSYLKEIDDSINERVNNYFSGDKDSNLQLILHSISR
jgi:hypothetical protein